MTVVPPGVHRLVPVGWITLAFGAADVLRLISEICTMTHLEGTTVTVMVLDFILGVTAVRAEWGLKRPDPDTWASTMFAWGALSVSSAAIGLLILPNFLAHVFSNSQWILRILPRMLFHAASLLIAPYAIWMILTHPMPPRPRWVPLARWLGAGMFLAGVVCVFVYEAK